MGKLYYYCPECKEIYRCCRVNYRIFNRHSKSSKVVQHYSSPTECFNCGNRILEVLSYKEIKKYKLDTELGH